MERIPDLKQRQETQGKGRVDNLSEYKRTYKPKGDDTMTNGRRLIKNLTPE